MKRAVIGTAGHIDHGKTCLIKALTGRDTDRLAEEKRRGITIDLGFTWFDLEDGTRCGVIDVPGHEKFIGNMLSGVTGMDLVLLVVAADEGVMPQTREHLDILELLGIEKLILVLTKCDLVEPDWLDMAEEEIRRDLAGTIAESAPAARVSAMTGEGIPELKRLMGDMIRAGAEVRDARGPARLPIDRVFTVPGFGTVVTGTLLAGTLARGQEAELYPAETRCRIRKLQVHGADRDTCRAGERVAANLAGVRLEQVRRGFCLAPPGSMENTRLLDVRLRVLKSSERVIRNRERLHLFIGTGEVLCRAVMLDREDLGPGEEGYAQLLLEDVLAVKRGDRFVVRFYSPLETIGGGIVLGSADRRKKRFRPEVVEELARRESGSPSVLAEMRIREAWDRMLPLSQLLRDMDREREELLPLLRELEADGRIELYAAGSELYCWHADAALEARQRIESLLEAYHARYPYRRGPRRTSVRSECLKYPKINVADMILRRMTDKGWFRLEGESICLPGFEIPRDETFLAVERQLTEAFEGAGYELLRLGETGAAAWPEETVQDILALLLEEGRCVRVSEDPALYTMRHLMDEAADRIRSFLHENGRVTVSQIREMLSTNRKSARAIVEYMDRTGVTKKVGAETERVAAG